MTAPGIVSQTGPGLLEEDPREKTGKKIGAMKLTIERGALLHSLGHVQSVVERRNTIPILSNVLLEAKGDRLGLTATDMELAIVEHVAVDAGQAGAVTVPAHTLYDIVRKLPEGAQVQLELSADGQQTTIKAGRSRFTLQA